MIKAIFICFAPFVFCTACNKKNYAGTTTVEYQVVVTNSSKIDITYNNVLGNKIMVTAQDGWTFDITDVKKPFTAYIQAASTSPFSSVTTTSTVNILVNGSIVKTDTASSNTVATAEAEYILQ